MKFCYFIFIFFSIFFHAQRYTSRWYGMDQGLPQNSIKDITKDKYGFIWLATDSGILRFDGTNFLLYNNFNVKNLSFKDFFECGKDGIANFNNWEEECVLIKDRTVQLLPNKKVSRTFFIENGKQYKRFYKNSFISSFFPDIDAYYIKTNSETYFFNGKNVQYVVGKGLKKIITDNFPLKLLRNAFEHNNVLYIGDTEKRRTFILKNGKISYDNIPSLYNDPESKIYWHQGTKQVFVINNGNIYISKLKNGKPTLSFLMEYKKIEKELLYCMFYDEDAGKMYFGNVVKGLNIISLSNFYVPQKNVPFTGEVVYEAQPFTQNSIITKQGFEFYKDKVERRFSINAKSDRRFLLYDDSANLLYVEFNKIQKLYKDFGYQKRDSVSFQDKNVLGIFKSDKKYMVNMTDLKFSYYDLHVFPDDRFRKAENIFRFKDFINYALGIGDELYVATSNGLYLVSLSKHKILKHLAKNLIVKQIQRTKDGNLWLLTYGKGIYLLKDDRAIAMPYDKDGYIANAHHILEDSHGFFWISSNNGLFKVSKKILLDYAQNKKTKVTWYRYTKENGFLNNEFNGSSNPCGNILGNGDFVFPSMEGFVFFKPDEVKTHYPKSDQLFVERAKVGKKIIHFKDTLRLKSDYKTAEIFIDIPYYHNIENIYMETNLVHDGNKGWDEVKNDRKYTLSNIGPGNYTLHIKFLVSDNGKFAHKKIRIEIKPFFYQTIWFKILIGLIGLTIFLLIIQIRTNFLRSKNEKLKSNLHSRNQELKETSQNLEITRTKLKNESEYQQKIMESISHDITTPVRFIALMSQKLSDAENAQNQKKYFDSIYKTSEQLFKFTLNLKEYTELYKEENVFDEEEYFIFEIVEEKKLLFEGIASESDTIILNFCGTNLKTNVNKNILSAILHNLIDNAVKNTKGGIISVKTSVVNEEIEIGIFDTGKGMSQSQIQYYSQVFERMETENFVFKNYGLGLHMVIQLSKKIDAKISFHENIPKGTIVKVLLKN